MKASFHFRTELSCERCEATTAVETSVRMVIAEARSPASPRAFAKAEHLNAVTAVEMDFATHVCKRRGRR